MPSIDQRSLLDQLRDLIPLANQAGMYDAADYLRDVVEHHEMVSKSKEVRPTMTTETKQPINTEDILRYDLTRVTIAVGVTLADEKAVDKNYRERVLESLDRIADALRRLRGETIKECLDTLWPEYPDAARTLKLRMKG
jgi:hypothetical protein